LKLGYQQNSIMLGNIGDLYGNTLKQVIYKANPNKLKLQDNIVTNPYKDDDGQQELDYLTFHSLTENELSDWVKLF
jgi:hypothetical protein